MRKKKKHPLPKYANLAIYGDWFDTCLLINLRSYMPRYICSL